MTKEKAHALNKREPAYKFCDPRMTLILRTLWMKWSMFAFVLISFILKCVERNHPHQFRHVVLTTNQSYQSNYFDFPQWQYILIANEMKWNCVFSFLLTNCYKLDANTRSIETWGYIERRIDTACLHIVTRHNESIQIAPISMGFQFVFYFLLAFLWHHFAYCGCWKKVSMNRTQRPNVYMASIVICWIESVCLLTVVLLKCANGWIK